MARCPHGDPFCPCQDGDSCHYEGPDPFPCPNPPMHEQTFTAARIVKLNPDGSLPEDLDLIPESPIRHVTLRSSYPTEPHCHVEGCSWRLAGNAMAGGQCGLARLDLLAHTAACNGYELGCGLTRRVAEFARHEAKA